MHPDPQFKEAVEAWHDFYLMAGTAAVTLVGLLFVALSMHVAVLFRPDHARTREMAFQAFQGFLYVLISSLLFLAPSGPPKALGVSYALMNLVLLVRTVLRLRVLPKRSKSPAGGERIGPRAFTLFLPGLAYGQGVALGVITILDGFPKGNLFMIPPLLVLAGATRTAWELLENVARIEGERAAVAASEDPAQLVDPGPVE